LNVAAALVVAALAAALVAAGAGAGAETPKLAAAKSRHAGAFRQTLAAKLGEQLHKPAADVLAAMKTARRARAASPADRRAARLSRRAKRLAARAKALRTGRPAPGRRAQHARRAIQRRDAWAAALAQPLGVDASTVTAALRALVAERLDSLVRDGWLTSERRDAELACFDDASACAGVGRPPGLALLRAGL
jgi:hypothetical protein